MRKPPIVLATALVAAALLLPFRGTMADQPEASTLTLDLVAPAQWPWPETVAASDLYIAGFHASYVRESISFEHGPAKRGYGQG